MKNPTRQYSSLGRAADDGFTGIGPGDGDDPASRPRSLCAAINSNDFDTLMADLADDIVHQSPRAPEIVGKAAVRAWTSEYLAAYRTHWEKTSIRFTVRDDWACERYTYTSRDTEKKTGVVAGVVGKGINIFRRGRDGKWRVAVDGWSSDRPGTP